jgi:hypothetical protein
MIEGIINGQTMNESLIDVNVTTKVERCVRGIALLEPKMMPHLRHQLAPAYNSFSIIYRSRIRRWRTGYW